MRAAAVPLDNKSCAINLRQKSWPWGIVSYRFLIEDFLSWKRFANRIVVLGLSLVWILTDHLLTEGVMTVYVVIVAFGNGPFVVGVVELGCHTVQPSPSPWVARLEIAVHACRDVGFVSPRVMFQVEPIADATCSVCVAKKNYLIRTTWQLYTVTFTQARLLVFCVCVCVCVDTTFWITR